MGNELSGEVISEGRNVKKNLIMLPDPVSFQDAALIEPLDLVSHGISRLQLPKKESSRKKIVIIGAGFLRLLFMQLMNSRDYLDVIIDRNEFKLILLPMRRLLRSTLLMRRTGNSSLKQDQHFTTIL